MYCPLLGRQEATQSIPGAGIPTFLSAINKTRCLQLFIDDLYSRRFTIAGLATVGVIISTILTGYAAYYIFKIVGLEVFAIQFKFTYLISGLMVIPTVLAVRFISVSIPISLLRLKREFSTGVIRILTWSGLRGGISVALVLSLPPFQGRDLLLTCTYIVVLFSIIVQGLTLKPLVNRIQSGIKE